MDIVNHNDLINKLQTIINGDNNDIFKFYRNLCYISDDIKEHIPNESSLYQNFKTDINCIYNQIIYVDCEYDENVIFDCIITLNDIIDYLDL